MVAIVIALQGCTTAPTSTPSATPAPLARPVAALTVERDWLQSWFGGTPVVIVQRADGLLSVDIPLEFCFDSGRSIVKPALAALLDKVAESLRRTSARLQFVAAPADPGGAPALALRRAAQVRTRLLSRGVPAAQLNAATTTTAAAVQLRIEPAPQ